MSSEYDPRITAYFGSAVMRAGFMPIPHLFMRHYRQLGLSSTQAMFLLQIMESAWDLADPPKTVGDLARRMDVDSRTIRKYSEEIARLHLIVLYDQYDANGAQIENGYDLAPLFNRLTELAPELPPSTTFRRRDLTAPAASTSLPVPPTVSEVAPPGGLYDPPPPDHTIRPPEDHTIRPAPAQAIRPPRIIRSGLKRNLRIIKNHQELKGHKESLLHDAAALTGINQSPLVVAPCPRGLLAQDDDGWSLRWGQPITPQEVATSGHVLQRMGIDQPVRRLIASSLAPAEAWVLRVYAEAKCWRVPLTITQVYDKTLRCPRAAIDLDSRYDAVGRMLAALDAPDAEAIMTLIPRHCPDNPQAVLDDPLITGGEAAQKAAAQAVWTMMAELRGSRSTSLEMNPSKRAGTALRHLEDTDATAERAWTRALVEMRSQMPAEEFNTWIGQACLVEVAETHVIVGTPNIFVRDKLESIYGVLLQTTLHAALGRAVDIHVVIGL